MEKYSVLMSLYMKEKPEYLKESVLSMVVQTYKPDEIVIVKDGPLTTELETVLTEIDEEYPNLLHIVGYKTNRGLGFALNYGLKFCKNELVARMDTDDISMPDRCEKQIKYIKKHAKTDIVGGDIAEFIEDINSPIAKRLVPITNTKIKKYMKTRCPFNHVTVMFKKSAVIKAGGYRDCFWNEDYYLWIRMYECGCRFGNIGNILVNVRVGEDMYRRRGGWKYFKSEMMLQHYMLQRKIIDIGTFLLNSTKRFIVQVILPTKIRGWFFRMFARN
ncbi:MAG: glycosyltransferase [Bacteroides sp.]|nr:glycosyltransferase [Bacteroides sp.]